MKCLSKPEAGISTVECSKGGPVEKVLAYLYVSVEMDREGAYIDHIYIGLLRELQAGVGVHPN